MLRCKACKHLVNENVVDAIIGFPLVIAESELDIPGIELGPIKTTIFILLKTISLYFISLAG